MADADVTLRDRESRWYEAPIPTIRVLFEAERGFVAGRLRSLGRQPLHVGRAVEEGIKLADPRASRHHATIRSDGEAVEVEDTSSNGTFVNGRPVRTTTLSNGDVLRVGNSFLLFRREPPAVEEGAVRDLVGEAPAIKRLRRTIERVAGTDATLLVVGESGTGKELVARAIHELSERKGPFVAVNCSAIPETLAESQLFGHRAGAFTGAKDDHQGYFRAAEGGTLFLDEIGELSVQLQPKLLRVLEDQEVTPVGRVKPVHVDVRVLAATNRDLEQAVDEGSFRGDLFARLTDITVRTPPLRERREDILPLLAHALGSTNPALDPDLVEGLLLHPFRFNVRELFKIAKELRIKGDNTPFYDLSLLEGRVAAPAEGREPAVGGARDSQPELPGANHTPREPIPSRESFEALMREHRGNVSRLARALGRSRKQVYRYMEMFGFRPEDYR